MKELIAILLLCLIIAGALWNVHHLDGLVSEIVEMIDEGEALAARGEFDEATEVVKKAAERWHGSAPYTHIFLRHTEIDGSSDAFYELLSEVKAGDYKRAAGAFEKVRVHLNGLADMERLSLGSLF